MYFVLVFYYIQLIDIPYN